MNTPQLVLVITGFVAFLLLLMRNDVRKFRRFLRSHDYRREAK